MSPSPKPLFLQIHTLTSYPGTLLNRDDAGFAKRLPFGGATRTRVSSQCLKRHWRTFQGERALSELNVGQSIRSRSTFDLKIAQKLIEEGSPEALVTAVVRELMHKVQASDKSKDDKLMTGQLTVMGEPEVDYLRQVAREFVDGVQGHDDFDDEIDEALSKAQQKIVAAVFKERFKDKEFKANLRGLKMGAGLGAALFGRMVTSDVLARGDAAIHVAHALTVHAEESESDYFSAVDDLAVVEGELGSAHINSSELTSGLFYGYVVVDVPLLISNLEGVAREQWREADSALAANIVERLVHLIATVSPGAKLGSTAPYANAHCVIVEAGSSQPRTLANAFLRPVSKQGDLLANAYAQLGDYLEEFAQMYGPRFDSKIAGIGLDEALLHAAGGEKVALEQLANWAGAQIPRAGGVAS